MNTEDHILLRALRNLEIEDIYYLGEVISIRRAEIGPGNIIRLSVALLERARIAGQRRALTKAIAEQYPSVWMASRRTEMLKGNPYRGLSPLGVKDRGRFFGRDREIRELTNRLIHSGTSATSGPILVVGASGSGKSSLIGAGLLPVLADDENRRWRWGKLTPHSSGAGPVAGLAGALTRAFGWVGPDYASNKQKVLDGMTQDHGLSDLVHGNLEDDDILLLWVDQFEELFVGISEIDRKEFLSKVFSLMGERFRTIFNLRAEFYHRCLEEQDYLLPYLETCQFPLGLPDAAGLAAIIQCPAENAGLEIEPELVGQLIADTGTEPGNLALLAFALEDTYRNFRATTAESPEDATLKREHYRGLRDVLGERAEGVLAGFADAEKTEFERAFVHLVELAPDRPPTRRQARLDFLRQHYTGASSVLEALVEARLLVSNQEEGYEPTLEVAHEALFANWKRIRELIERMRNDLFLRNLFEREVNQWVAAGRDIDSLVLKGGRLEQALEWQARNPHFGDQFPSARDRDQERIDTVVVAERLKIPALEADGWTAASLSAHGRCLILGNGAGDVAIFDLDQAELSVLRASVHARAVSALALSPDGRRAISVGAEEALLWDVDRGDWITPLRGHSSRVVRAIFNADGSSALTLARGYQQALLSNPPIHTRLLWDPATGVQKCFPNQTLADDVSDACFSRDGRLLATVGPNIRIWNLKSGRNQAMIANSAESYSTATFSSCGTKLLYASLDGIAGIADADSGSELRVFPAIGRGRTLTHVRFNDADRSIVTAASDGTLTLWDLETDEPITQIAGRGSSVVVVTFLGSGRFLLAVFRDGSTSIWEVATGKVVEGIVVPEAPVLEAQVDQAGVTLATLTARECRVWNLTPKRTTKTCSGHRVGSIAEYIETCRERSDWERAQNKAKAERTLEFQSRFLANLARQQTDNGLPVEGCGLALEALPMDFNNPDRPLVPEAEASLYYAVYRGREIAYLCVKGYHYESQFSSDGKRLVSAYGDNIARIWDVVRHEVVIELKGHQDNIRYARFNCDDTLVATGSEDSNICIWDAYTGTLCFRFDRHIGAIESLQFLAASNVVLSAAKGEVFLWEAVSGEVLWESAKGEEFCGATCAPEDSLLFVYGERCGRLLDRKTLELVATLEPSHMEAKSVAPQFSSTADLLAIPLKKGKVAVYEPHSGHLLHVLEGSDSFLMSLAFEARGERLLVSHGDGAVEIWSPREGRCLATLKHPKLANKAIFDRTGEFVISVSNEGTVHIWNAESFQKVQEIRQPSDQVKELQVDPLNQVLLASGYQGVHLWSFQDEREARPLGPRHETAYQVEFSPDGRFVLTFLREGGFRLLETASVESIYHQDFGTVHHAVFDIQKNRFVWAFENSLGILDLNTLRPRRINFERSLRSFQSLADGTRFLAVFDNGLSVVDMENGHALANLELDLEKIGSAAVSSDDAFLVVVSEKKRVRFYELQTGNLLASIVAEHEKYMYEVLLSPVGYIAVTRSQSTMYFWNITTGELIDVINEGSDGWAFSTDGLELITADFRTISVWDLPTRTKKKSIWTPAQFSNSKIVVKPGLVSVVCNDQAQVWDLESGGMRAILGVESEGEEKMNDAAVSPTSNALATSYWETVSKLWPFFPDAAALAAHARDTLVRGLNTETRRISVLPPRPSRRL